MNPSPIGENWRPESKPLTLTRITPAKPISEPMILVGVSFSILKIRQDINIDKNTLTLSIIDDLTPVVLARPT